MRPGRGFILAALTAVILAGPAGGLPSTVESNPANLVYAGSLDKARGPCRSRAYTVRPKMGLEEVRRRVEALIRCVEDRWAVPGGADFAVRVARCESGLWPWARSPGGHLGLFQHVPSYWPGRVALYVRPEWHWKLRDRDPTTWPSPFNAWVNTVVSLRMARAGGWGPWSCA